MPAPTLPTTTAAFASTATEADFKTFLNDFRTFVAYMLGTTGLPADAIVGGIPSTTKMLFAQASAPTGWTKDTTHNDKALRVVSGSGGGSGGAAAFSTVFGRTASDASSLSEAQLAAHTHISFSYSGGGYSGSGGVGALSYQQTTAKTSSSSGSGYAHSHGMDMRVQYVDVIICTKS